jgi:hypothetical protein
MSRISTRSLSRRLGLLAAGHAAREPRLVLSAPDSERLRRLIAEHAAKEAANPAFTGLKPQAARSTGDDYVWLGALIGAVAVAGILAWRLAG